MNVIRSRHSFKYNNEIYTCGRIQLSTDQESQKQKLPQDSTFYISPIDNKSPNSSNSLPDIILQESTLQGITFPKIPLPQIIVISVLNPLMSSNLPISFVISIELQVPTPLEIIFALFNKNNKDGHKIVESKVVLTPFSRLTCITFDDMTWEELYTNEDFADKILLFEFHFIRNQQNFEKASEKRLPYYKWESEKVYNYQDICESYRINSGTTNGNSMFIEQI